MVDFLFKWQTLVGAMIGVAAPFVFSFITWQIVKYRKYYKDLFFIEKLIIYTINNLFDTKRTIINFINLHLKELISNINKRISEKDYSADKAFFPLFHINEITEQTLEINTKSGYIENSLMRTISMSKDFVMMISDAKKQFEDTVNENHKLAFSKRNLVDIHNQSYKNNIEGYIKFLKEELIETNIRIYLKQLVKMLVAVRMMRKIGFLRWYFKFSADFKYFRNKEAYNKFIGLSFERVDDYLKDEIEKELEDMKKKFEESLVDLSQ